MQHRLALLLRPRGAGLEHAMHIGFGNGTLADPHRRLVMLRADPAAGDVDDDALDLHAGHALGRIDRAADRPFRGFEIDDHAALQTGRTLMADAENPAAVGAPAQGLRGLDRIELGDETDDFRRPDIERRQNGRLTRGESTHARRLAHVRAPFAFDFGANAAARAAAAFSSQADEHPAGDTQIDR